jgi:hypothetical protein
MVCRENNGPFNIYAEAEITIEFFDLDPMQVVWHGNYFNYFEKDKELFFEEMKTGGDNWDFSNRTHFIRAEKNGNIQVIPVKHHFGFVRDLSWDGKSLIVECNAKPAVTNFKRRIKLSENGDIVSEETYQYINKSDELGNIRYTNEQTAYYDNNGNEIIPFGKYDFIYESGPFLVAQSGKNTDKSMKISIFNKQGNLLVENIYLYLTASRDGLYDENELIIYKDSNTCGWLSLDGTFQLIPNAPIVTRKYVGGG